MSLKVSIQGFEGSFHQIAAQQFLGKNIEVVPCATFREVVDLTKNGSTDASVMAIENSIAGSILPNYNLLQKSNLTIIGEVYLPIKQHLLVNPGIQLSDIQEVHSHPMAIQQCLDFLLKHNWKLVETEDTAPTKIKIEVSKIATVCFCLGHCRANININLKETNYFLYCDRRGWQHPIYYGYRRTESASFIRNLRPLYFFPSMD